MNTDQTFREAARWARAHKGALAAATAAVLGLGATSVVAETGGVPQALNQLQATVNTLIATVNQLTIKVDQLPKAGPSAPALYTSALVAQTGQSVACSVTNIGPTPTRVEVAVFNGSGALLGAVSLFVAPMANSRGTLAGPGTYACRFTPSDVPTSQLRAIATLTGADDVPMVLTEAT